jgi:hypothetical protein
MIPKGKLLALLLAFTAVGGLAATGAFTTVEAERTADVSVDGDANALLGITPNDQANNDFVNQGGTGDSELQIDLTGQNGNNGNLNTDAATNEENIITITNNGQNTVSFFIATEGGLQDGSVGADGNNEGTAGYNDISDNVNVEFYVDDGNVVGTSDGSTSPGDGEVVVNSTATSTLQPLASDINSDFDTFVDGSTGTTDDSADYTISQEGRSESPNSNATAVKLAPGESVDVSIYIEIDLSDDEIDLSSSGPAVLDNIVIIAVDSGTVTGELQDTQS